MLISESKPKYLKGLFICGATIAGQAALFGSERDIAISPKPEVSYTEKMEEAPDRPNIVWLLSEDNSIHFLKLFDENGAETPAIKAMAQHGIKFTHAFSNAPVCSSARSALISGCYGPRICTQYHRKSELVPMPDGVRMFPAYLRDAGYYTTNNQKEDYNVIKADDVWDESSGNAHWRNRKPGQPFFHQQNIGNTHESCLHFSMEKMNNTKLKTDPESVFIAPNHPNTELFRFTNAFYRDQMQTADEAVASIIEDLRKDGLLENTFIFYFGDNGGVLPGSKGYAYDVGLHVPLVVRVPENYRHLADFSFGESTDGFVSFIDFGPTVLQLAGLSVPPGMDGKPFLGRGIKKEEIDNRNIRFGYADRFDEKYDQVRSIRKGSYTYIRRYQPFIPDGLQNNYRYIMLAYQEWRDLYYKGELNEVQSRFFRPGRPEALYDIDKDPYETVDLSDDPEYQEILSDLRNELNSWVKGMPDLSFFPESELSKEAFRNPARFGQEHKEQIAELIEVADLSLIPFKKAKKAILNALDSEDAMKRYWALIVCSAFGEKAESFYGKARNLAKSDPHLLVRVRAAEFLALAGNEDPVPVITKALMETENSIEANLILNSVVLLTDHPDHYNFNLHAELLKPQVLNSDNVQLRMNYILQRQDELFAE